MVSYPSYHLLVSISLALLPFIIFASISHSANDELNSSTWGQKVRLYLTEEDRPCSLESVDTLEKIWGILQKGLKNSQIYAFRGTVKQKKEEWSPAEEDCS
jgi:hypothetical protein